MSNSMQWIQYSIIANVITRYYDISSAWVDWTSMVYMVSYIVLIVPGSWAINTFGLKKCVAIGAGGTCIGSWIKAFSLGRDKFWVGFAGQSVVAASQVFILSVPARLAALWFGPKEVSSACSIGVFGNQLGIAVGFVLPPLMVGTSNDTRVIGDNLGFMFNCIGALSTAIFVLIIILFKDAPPMPPSVAQAALKDKPEVNFSKSIGHLTRNFGYILLLISYGINVGVFYAISTLLNPIILSYFPGAEVDCGRMGLVMVVAGMVGSVISGVILDKTHKFKETTLVIYVFSLVGMVIYTLTLNSGHIAVVYFTVGFLGFFMTGYLPVGFELAAELTYPEPEATSAGLLNGVVQVFGILFTNLYALMFQWAGVFWANAVLSATLVVGSVITAVIPARLKRQEAAHKLPDDPDLRLVKA
ncbi:hypothetical protein AAG570_014077 [Ranatra chinensis]|uniref:Choline/ethanolamine transporter FLVCR1 n=1 Tax=Ranatra chinensis TaxID=642074 RepID=A0ABD0Y5E6_9HEMI